MSQELKEVNKELIIKELKELKDKEVDVLYVFLESLVPKLSLEEIKEWETLLDFIDNKELINE